MIGSERDPVLHVSLRRGEVSVVNERLRAGGFEDHTCDRAGGRVIILPGGLDRDCGSGWDSSWRSSPDDQASFRHNRQILHPLCLNERRVHPAFALGPCLEIELQPGSIWIFAGELHHILWIQRAKRVETGPRTAAHIDLLLNDGNISGSSVCLAAANGWNLRRGRGDNILSGDPAFSING